MIELRFFKNHGCESLVRDIPFVTGNGTVDTVDNYANSFIEVWYSPSVDGRIPLRRLVGIGDYLFTNHEFGQASKIIVEIGDFSWEG